MAKKDPLYDAYVRAKAKQWRDSRTTLKPKEYLDIVDPKGKHSDAQANLYMENLRTGKWQSSTVLQRSQQTGGQIYNILLADKSGRIVDSANVELPKGRSLSRAIEDGTLERAVERYLSSRHSMKPSDQKKYGIESVGHKSMKGLKIVGAEPLRTTRKIVQIVS